MARPIWSGVITFGLVTVPVQLFSAIEDHAVHFHQLERGTNDRVRNRRVNERTGKSVDYQDIVKGYDLGDGDHVVVEPEELDEIAPGKSQVIEVSGFVELDEVEPAYFGRTYYLAPRSEEYGKVYGLLRASLERSDKIGVATFVMHSKEYLVALRAQDDVLALHTLHWADEVRDPRRTLPRLPQQEPKGKELKTAQQLIDTMTISWRPEDYEDTYEKRVWQLVEAKRDGEEIVSEEETPEATNVVDLEEVLQRSVDQAGSGSGKAKSSGGSKRSSGRRTGRGGGGSGRKSERGVKQEGRREVAQDLRELSKQDLYERAAAQDVPGRSRMNREQLIDALGDRKGAKAAS